MIKTFINNTSRKQKIVNGGCILLVILEIIFIYLAIVSYNNKNLDKYIFGVNSKANKMFAIMLEDENGDYKAYNGETFPEFPYIFNNELSQCMDIKGNVIEDAISYDEDINLANVVVTKTSQCYFYFNRPKEVGAFLNNRLINSGELWQSGLEGDGYRYVGSGSYDNETTPNNFICFGTSDKTECKNNESKYLYRIIGVFEGSDGKQHLKLISLKQLSSTYSWHSDYSTDTDWADSALYTGLNGDYFLTNTTYDYMQNSTWLNKIENWTWTAVNTLTDQSVGPNYSSLTTEVMYLHEMNRSREIWTTGEWTTPVAKIGLMYASDYQMSLGSSSLSYTGSSNASTLKTGWMHQSNNDTTASSNEWTLSRYGAIGSYFDAWYVYSTGYVREGQVVRITCGVRPVFYLTSDIIYDSGSGTYSDPYTILEASTTNNLYESNLSVSVQLNENEVTGTITQGEYDLNKYCINTSSNSYENCTWKKIDSLTITDTLPDYGIYYLHIIDKGGYVVHSKGIKYLELMINKLISSGELWQSDLESDGYRYVGSGNYDSDTTPNNFICFGTSDKTECKNNEAKYLYRIIGVFPDSNDEEHLKLISFGSIENLKWLGSSSQKDDISWQDSYLYSALNGSYFLTNSTYDYLQNDVWLNKIENWNWTSTNTQTEYTQTGSSGTKSIDYSEATVKNIYLHEMNRSTKSTSVGAWSTDVGKIGLMYVSDYALSLGSSALSYTSSSNYTTLVNGWIHQSNNNSTATWDWTITRYGISFWVGNSAILGVSNTYSAWNIYSAGKITTSESGSERNVRPVFYLTSDVTHNSGTGTYSDPYIINE